MLGQTNFNLSEFIGKINEEVELHLKGGLVGGKSNSLFIKVSILPLDRTSEIGVDNKTLLEENAYSVVMKRP